jgi:hypothetical protein
LEFFPPIRGDEKGVFEKNCPSPGEIKKWFLIRKQQFFKKF